MESYSGHGPVKEKTLVELAAAAAHVGGELSDRDLDALWKWAELVIEWRQAAQLTALRTPEAVVRALMLPAVYAIEVVEIDSSSVIVDLGCGSGCTGVTLASITDGSKWYLVDSARKKVTFCRYALGECRMEEIKALTREEWLETGLRADVLLARALPATERVDKTLSRIVKQGGVVVRWCTHPKHCTQARVARCGTTGLWVCAETR